MILTPEVIQDLAAENGWLEIDHQKTIRMLSFSKNECRVNIYYSTMTVATCLEHPLKGKTQLFRQNINFSILEKIFKNPRIHTGTGYYQKRRIENDNRK